MTRPGRGRLVLVGAVAAAVALAPACSEDRRSASATTTTTSTTLPDPAVYVGTLDRLSAEVEASRGDLCALRSIPDEASAAGRPTDADQAKRAALFIGLVYGAIGDAAPDPADRQTIREGADRTAAAATRPDFDTEAFIKNGPEAFADPAFGEALGRVQLAAREQCGASTPTSG